MSGNRKKRLLAIIGVGCAFMGWRGYALWTRGVTPAAAASVFSDRAGVISFPGVAPAGSVDGSGDRLRAAREAVANGPWGRNPFASPVSAARAVDEEPCADQRRSQPKPPSLQFTGVSKAGENWLAIVGGRIVRIGDELDAQYRVVEITKNSLTVASPHWAFRYELGGMEPAVHPVTEGP